MDFRDSPMNDKAFDVRDKIINKINEDIFILRPSSRNNSVKHRSRITTNEKRKLYTVKIEYFVPNQPSCRISSSENKEITDVEINEFINQLNNIIVRENVRFDNEMEEINRREREAIKHKPVDLSDLMKIQSLIDSMKENTTDGEYYQVCEILKKISENKFCV